MKITYDRTADAVYIRLRPHPGESHVVRVADDVAIDLDREDHILGIEILGASEYFDPPGTPSVRLEYLTPLDPGQVEESPPE